MNERSERVISEEAMRGAPAWTPSPTELADLELLLAGAYTPLTGFLGQEDVRSIRRAARLSGGEHWPVPITLEVPAGMLDGLDPRDPAAEPSVLLITDEEGAPVARLDITETWETRPGWVGVAGPVARHGDGGHAPFAAYRMDTGTVRGLIREQRVLGVFVDRPLHRPQLAQVAHAARQLMAQVVVLVPYGGHGAARDGVTPEVLMRCVLAARDRLPNPVIVAVPLADRGNELSDALLRARVAAAFGVTHLLSTAGTVTGAGLRILVPRELSYDSRDGQWRDRDDVPQRFERRAL
ncbi:MAG TPA: hypothetical protein VF062_03240, partial [Candidatus Limnocylindrales bacterium]